MIRPPRYAGSFYPESQEGLIKTLNMLFKDIEPIRMEGKLRGLLCPHAGYIYSGRIAASGYILLKEIFVKDVIIIGPSHHVAFDGACVYGKGKWVTPLGEVSINEILANELISTSKYFFKDEELHAVEHSIEVQIPFLQYILGEEFNIIPVMIGFMDKGALSGIAGGLREFLMKHPDVIVIVSSDLYHGYSYKECLEKDRKTIHAIKNMDGLKFFDMLERGEVMACGGHGISIVIEAFKNMHVSAREIEYTNSAEVTGIYTGYVVGYVSMAFEEVE